MKSSLVLFTWDFLETTKLFTFYTRRKKQVFIDGNVGEQVEWSQHMDGKHCYLLERSQCLVRRWLVRWMDFDEPRHLVSRCHSRSFRSRQFDSLDWNYWLHRKVGRTCSKIDFEVFDWVREWMSVDDRWIQTLFILGHHSFVADFYPWTTTKPPMLLSLKSRHGWRASEPIHIGNGRLSSHPPTHIIIIILHSPLLTRRFEKSSKQNCADSITHGLLHQSMQRSSIFECNSPN